MASIVTRSRSGAKKKNNNTTINGSMIYQDTNTGSLDETGSSNSNNSKDKRRKSKSKRKKRNRAAFNDVSNNQQQDGSSGSSSRRGGAKKAKVSSRSRSKSKSSKSSKRSKSKVKKKNGGRAQQQQAQVQPPPSQRLDTLPTDDVIDLTSVEDSTTNNTATDNGNAQLPPAPPAPQAMIRHVTEGIPPRITTTSTTNNNNMLIRPRVGQSSLTLPQSKTIELNNTDAPPLPLKVVKRPNIINIDAAHTRDPRYATTYANDIYAFRKQHELLYRPQGDFLKNFQKDITSNMRAILVDWLVEVAEEYNLRQVTLFTSVNYIDRCLALFQVTRHQLQLLGCACMLIASKYEEIYAPCVDEFVYISDNTYSHEQVLRMESKVLGYLKFRLTVCTIMTFLPRYLRASHAEDTHNNEEEKKRCEHLANYFAELALQDYEMVHYRQSTIAASCVSLARRTLKQNVVWHKTLQHYTGYDLNDIKTCEMRLLNRHQNIRYDKLQAVRRKNSSQEFMKVAYLNPIGSLEN